MGRNASDLTYAEHSVSMGVNGSETGKSRSTRVNFLRLYVMLGVVFPNHMTSVITMLEDVVRLIRITCSGRGAFLT